MLNEVEPSDGLTSLGSWQSGVWFVDHLATRDFLALDYPAITNIACFPYTALAGEGGIQATLPQAFFERIYATSQNKRTEKYGKVITRQSHPLVLPKSW
jgi:hypothetical protein